MRKRDNNKTNKNNKNTVNVGTKLNSVLSRLSSTLGSITKKKAPPKRVTPKRGGGGAKPMYGNHHFFSPSHHHNLRHHLRLKPHSVDYLASLTDPFNPVNYHKPLPAGGSGFTRTIRQKVTVTVGTNGNGFLLLNPSMYDVRENYSYTTSAYAGTAACNRGVAGAIAGVTGGKFTFPYTTAQLQAVAGLGADREMQFRIDSMALRARYTGSLLNRSGTVFMCAHPQNGDLSQLTFDEILSRFPECHTYSLHDDVDEYTNVWFPRTPGGREFYDEATTNVPFQPFFPTCNNLGLGYWDTLVGAGNTAGGTSFIFGVSGGVAGTTFQVDLVLTISYTGKPVGLSAVAIPNDNAGLDTIHSIVTSSEMSKSGDTSSDHKDHMVNSIENAVVDAAPAIEGVASMALGPEAGVAIAGAVDAFKTNKRKFNNTLKKLSSFM